MAIRRVPRLLISGSSAGAGKSLVTLGLCHELRRRNIGVSICSSRAAILQANIHRRSSGRLSHCLDSNLLNEEQQRFQVARSAVGAEVLLFDGIHGVFDGQAPGNLAGSDAQLATDFGLPMLFVADSRGFGSSLAALIHGFSIFYEQLPISHLLINRTGASGFRPSCGAEYYLEALERFNLIAPFALLPELDLPGELPCALLSEERNQTSLPRQWLLSVAQAVAENVNLDELLQLAESAPDIDLPAEAFEETPRRCRIAVSDDACFNVLIQDNLDLLRYFGAEIVGFSPLTDQQLPNSIQALYLTGGCLSEYGQEISDNSSMLASIRDFGLCGGVIYAEGGGAAYLCNEFEGIEHRQTHEGVGLIPGTARKNSRSAVQYLRAIASDDSILGPPGIELRGVSTGEWQIVERKPVLKVLKLHRGNALGWDDGYSAGAQIVATTAFLHFGSNRDIARALVDNAALYVSRESEASEAADQPKQAVAIDSVTKTETKSE